MINTEAKAQGPNIRYELHTLGWKAFQDLCATILSNLMGQTLQTFADSNDCGRDGAFHGTWTESDSNDMTGSFTVQCKFTNAPNKNLTPSLISDELAKAKNLAKNGFADNYIIMTNMGVSGRTHTVLENAFKRVNGIKAFHIFDYGWINRTIRENPKLRMMVPRVYGLGDLSQILDERAYDQAREILASIADDLDKFVITTSYIQSVQSINNHKFVILLGQPGSGKSIIASALALAAIDKWNCPTMKIDSPEDFTKHWNPNAPNQFFWVDDVFGATQYQKSKALGWTAVFPRLKSAIKKGARVIFTSRDYIFKAARSEIKSSGFPLIENSQVVINVEEITEQEKAQIIYNHIKLGDQPKPFRGKIKRFLPNAAKSPDFFPEIARRFGSPIFTKGMETTEEGVLDFVKRPKEYLQEIITELDSGSKAALSLVFMRNGALESPVDCTEHEKNSIERLGSGISQMSTALDYLRGSLLNFVKGQSHHWRFKHPTIMDAVADHIAKNPELIAIYLAGVSAERLISEITCGNIGLENVLVIVPESRYDVVLEKIKTFKQNYSLWVFLAYRCDEMFLMKYLDQTPSIFEDILNSISCVRRTSEILLLCRFHEYGLLPESLRQHFVSKTLALVLNYPNADFLEDHRIRKIFKDEEIKSAVMDFITTVLPKIEKTIEEWVANFDNAEDPESYFNPLIQTLKTYQNEIVDDPDAVWDIDNAIDMINEEIKSLSEKYDEDPDEEEMGTPTPTFEFEEDRSIFDDVDEIPQRFNVPLEET